jgi:hypothetical protein
MKILFIVLLVLALSVPAQAAWNSTVVDGQVIYASDWNAVTSVLNDVYLRVITLETQVALLVTKSNIPAPYDAMVFQNLGGTFAVSNNGTILSSVLISAHTDDVPIQAAINTTSAGSTVILAKSPSPVLMTGLPDALIDHADYTLSSGLLVPSGMSVIGNDIVLDCRAFDGAAIKINSDDKSWNYYAGTTKIEGVTLIGATTNTHSIGISAKNLQLGSLIDRVIVRYFDTGINIEGHQYRTKIVDSFVHMNRIGVLMWGGADGDGVNDLPHQTTIDHTDISSNTAFGIQHLAGDNLNVVNGWMEGNAVAINGSPYNVDNTEFGIQGNQKGIDIKGQYAKVHNCNFEIASGGVGVNIDALSAMSVITDNVFYLTDSSNPAKGVTVTRSISSFSGINGNTFYGENGATGRTTGIYGKLYGSTVTGNRFIGGTGINQTGANPNTGSNGLFSSNYFYYSARGIQIDGSNNRVSQNIFDTCAVTYNLTPGSGTNQIENNTEVTE